MKYLRRGMKYLPSNLKHSKLELSDNNLRETNIIKYLGDLIKYIPYN